MNMQATSAILAGALCAGALWAAEFWDEKDPAQWSEKEVERILTKSPWAKQVTGAMDFSRMGGGPPGGGMGGPGMGGPPGGGGGGMPPGGGGPGMGGGPPGGGGPGIGGGPPGGMPEMKATIRWESAEPVRLALRKSASEEEPGMYIISVSGMPMMGRGGNEQMAARRKQMLEQLKETTTLTGKGKSEIHASRVHLDEPTGTIYYFFAKEDPISAEAKDLTFTSKMGPMEFKAKFATKEMRFKGKVVM